MREGGIMKILKIENGGGYFNISNTSDWVAIDQIDKVNLMNLLNVFLESDVQLDDPNEQTISNQAQAIVYKSIYDKFKALEENKSKFKDESERTYLSAIKKYSEA